MLVLLKMRGPTTSYDQWFGRYENLGISVILAKMASLATSVGYRHSTFGNIIMEYEYCG